MKSKLSITTITLLIALLALYAVGFGIFTLNALRPSSEQIDKTGATIILTGGENRIKEGLLLLDKKLTKRVFISGVSKNNKLKDIVSNKTYRKVKCCVDLGKKAQDTIGNAQEAYEWLSTNKKIKSFSIVTSTYHMPRANYIFKKHENAGDYRIDTYYVAMERLSPDKREFWNLMFNEYNKLIYTWAMFKG